MITEIKSLLETPEPPELGPGPRSGVTAEKTLDEQLRRLGGSDLLRAMVLIWHDHLDAAHQIAQAIETPDGSYVHAIIHRREPDYWNSKYWFRRVGEHPCFAELANHVEDPKLRARLTGKGTWDPFAFVDLCEKGEGPNLLREIQATEINLLADYFASRKER